MSNKRIKKSVCKCLLFFLLLACMDPCLGKESGADPAVKAVLNSVNAWNGRGGKWYQEEDSVPHFSMNMLFRCAAPWKIACVHLGKTRLDLSDSAGTGPRRVLLSYEFSTRNRWPVLPPRPWLSLDAKGWLPHRNANWVEARGLAVVVVSRADKDSEVLEIPLEKGARVPVTLEKAVLNGKEENVRTALSVLKCFPLPFDPGGRMMVEMTLELPDGAAARGMEWRDEGRFPQNGYEQLLPGDCRNGKSEWWASVLLKKPESGRLNVRIRYASGLRESSVPVLFRIGMEGMILPEGNAGREMK